VENKWLIISLIWISGCRQMKDFKHKKTQEALWLQDQRNLPWVAAEIAVLAPGTVQLNIFACNQKLTKYVKGGQSEKVMQLFQQM